MEQPWHHNHIKSKSLWVCNWKLNGHCGWWWPEQKSPCVCVIYLQGSKRNPMAGARDSTWGMSNSCWLNFQHLHFQLATKTSLGPIFFNPTRLRSELCAYQLPGPTQSSNGTGSHCFVLDSHHELKRAKIKV